MRSFFRNSRLLLPLVVFILMSLFLWRGLQRHPHRIPSPLINKPMPMFHLSTLENPDRVITNQAFKGHLVILNVFATWCLSCHAEHPVLMDIANSHQVLIYGLNYKDNRQATRQWLAKYGNPYTKIIFDPRGQLAINLGVYGTPETYVIDSRGIIRYKYIGPLSPQAWRDVLLPKINKLKLRP